MPENRQTDEQRIISVFSILEWAEAFIVDRKASGLSPNTIVFYRNKLKKFIEFCGLNHVRDIQELNAKQIREYLLWLESKNHNKGGVHAQESSQKTNLFLPFLFLSVGASFPHHQFAGRKLPVLRGCHPAG